MVGLNRGLVSDPAAPFGGTKQSGIGREGGHEGMLDYMESKYVAVAGEAQGPPRQWSMRRWSGRNPWRTPQSTAWVRLSTSILR